MDLLLSFRLEGCLLLGGCHSFFEHKNCLFTEKHVRDLLVNMIRMLVGFTIYLWRNCNFFRGDKFQSDSHCLEWFSNWLNLEFGLAICALWVSPKILGNQCQDHPTYLQLQWSLMLSKSHHVKSLDFKMQTSFHLKRIQCVLLDCQIFEPSTSIPNSWWFLNLSSRCSELLRHHFHCLVTQGWANTQGNFCGTAFAKENLHNIQNMTPRCFSRRKRTLCIKI